MTNQLVGSVIEERLFTVRGHTMVMREVHRETMYAIRDELWPFHFTTQGYSRYGFQKRTAKYQIMKARTVHHLRPNEFSGDLRRAVLTESVVRATAKRGSLQAKGPTSSKVVTGRGAGRVFRRALTDERRKEIEVVSESEQSALMGRQAAWYVEMANDPGFIDCVRKRM